MVTWADEMTAISTAVAAVTAVVAAFVLLGAVVYAGLQLRSAEKARRLQMVLNLSARWESALLREGRRLTIAAGPNLARDMRRYKRGNRHEYLTLHSLANFFEDLSILEAEDQVKLNEIRRRFKSVTIAFHAIFLPYLNEIRKQYPNAVEHWDTLVCKLKN